MMMHDPPVPRGFPKLAIITLIVGALLIWIGAAVTTTGSGMAFADWPLSNGSVNPQGWLTVTPQFLEHGHRLLASSVGILVLAMFIWLWLRAKHSAHQVLFLVVAFFLIFLSVHVADGMGKKAEMQVAPMLRFPTAGMMWAFSLALGAIILVWLWRGLRSSRWNLLLKLTAAALVTVVAQAVLGGLRVLEISDPFGIAHGCLGQLFYCLLIAIVLVSSPVWARGGIRLPEHRQQRLLLLASALFLALVVQLILGAVVRHTQRGGLAASDVLTTGGYLIPRMLPFATFSIFLHKAWGLLVFLIAIVTGIVAGKSWRVHGWVIALPRLLLVLPIFQVTLGVFVVFTGKKFWVTNFHVLNGLILLGTAFLVLVTAWRSIPLSAALAREDGRHHPDS